MLVTITILLLLRILWTYILLLQQNHEVCVYFLVELSETIVINRCLVQI